MNEPCAKITLDVQQISSATFIAVKRGDVGREICITLSDGGFPYEIESDCYAVLTATKPDGNILYNHCDIDENTIIYEITEQTTAAAGRMKAEVKLYGADDSLVTSATFRIIVDGTVYNDAQVESSSEFSALTELVSTAKALVDEVEQKLENGEFIGPQGPEGPQGEQGGGATVDTTLTQSGQAADAAVVGQKFTDLTAATETSQSTADNAQTAADNAQTTADEAKEAADNAQTAAEAAQTSADTAQTAAETAQATADAAQTSAKSAKSAADMAQYTANSANSAASSATTKANAASTTATQAQTLANSAQKAAIAAQETADAAIKAPDTASVGQTIVVKAVDDTGKPTEWEAVDLPSGGSGNYSGLIAIVEISDEVDSITLNTGIDGNPLNLSDGMYLVSVICKGTASNASAKGVLVKINGYAIATSPDALGNYDLWTRTEYIVDTITKAIWGACANSKTWFYSETADEPARNDMQMFDRYNGAPAMARRWLLNEVAEFNSVTISGGVFGVGTKIEIWRL